MSDDPKTTPSQGSDPSLESTPLLDSSPSLKAAPSGRRRLHKAFGALGEFQEEYRRNIANGGIFIRTAESFAMREIVDVELFLEFTEESVLLEGEVVNQVPPGRGVASGVAIQLLEPAPSLRQRLGSLAELPNPSFNAAPGRPTDERTEPRTTSRVVARLKTAGRPVAGRTSNLSRSGALLVVQRDPPAVGTRVRLELSHPMSGETFEIEATVTRQAPEEGHNALAVRFDPMADDDPAALFVERVRAADHARRIAAILGPIQTLGLPNLVQMFSSCTDTGTLRVTNGVEDGEVAFESGTFAFARAGKASGLKALARMLGWEEGWFEFHSNLERPADLPSAEPIPMYGAVMEALQQVDEVGRLDTAVLPRATPLHLGEASPDDLDKLESAIVERVRAGGASVGCVLDALPDFDAAIYAALLALVEREIVHS
jgi:Tfp pilus assembly protein PilZ